MIGELYFCINTISKTYSKAIEKEKKKMYTSHINKTACDFMRLKIHISVVCSLDKLGKVTYRMHLFH